jgi:hypothetical protein
MKRSDISELHFITPIENLASILEYGILCHNRAKKLHHKSVAMNEIQERRRDKRIPGAGVLHDYANLYFDAHNPMLSRLRGSNDRLAVLRVDPVVLDKPDVVICDCNASADWARFFTVGKGLEAIDSEIVFARYWTHQDQYEEWEHKSKKCAEVLVPVGVDPRYILGAYVANSVALGTVNSLGIGLQVRVNAAMFF